MEVVLVTSAADLTLRCTEQGSLHLVVVIGPEKTAAGAKIVIVIVIVSSPQRHGFLAWMRTMEWFKDQGAKPEHFVLSRLCQQLINR